MASVLKGICCMALGWLGWWLGEGFGLFTAMVLSSIGSGLGLYLGYRINRHYFG